MANFQTWSDDKLKCIPAAVPGSEHTTPQIPAALRQLYGRVSFMGYIRFVGKDPKSKPHDELVLKAVKVYSSDPNSLPRFESHWSQSHGAPGQHMQGGAFPPMAASNPYPSVAYPGATPAAGSQPAAGAPGGGMQYPTLNFAPPTNVGAPAASNPYPTFPPGGASMPGAAPAAASNPYPAPGVPGQGAAFPAPMPGGAANPYPSPAQPSAPVINHAAGAASNPYPTPGAAGAPGGAFPVPGATGQAFPSPSAPSAPANPYPAPGAAASQPAGNPYPAPGGTSAPPGPTGAPANPYPEMSIAGAPAVNPYGAQSPAPTPAAGNHYPTAAFPTPTPAAGGHSSGFAPPAQAGGATHPAQLGHSQQQYAQKRPQQQQQHRPQQQQQHIPQQQQPQARGRKKALLVGCNYPGTRSELKGCCTDVQHIEYLLKTRFGFQDITVLRDDLHRQDVMPTKRNILAHIDKLVHGAQPNDSLFFHFSGHGSQKRDYSGDERDGMNETLVPTDHERAGQLVDDELNKRLVNPLPPGVRLHALLDACHSGTGLDLPYVTKMERGTGRLYWESEGPTRVYKGTRGGLAVQFGACKDSQLAQDTAALSGGTHTGAATYLFIQSVEQLIGHKQPLTYGRIISEMLRQIKEFQKRQSGGRGLEGGQGGQQDSTRSGLGGMLVSMLIQGAMSAVAGGGGGGGGLGGLMSAFLGGGAQMQGQTPQLSCSDAIDLNMTMQL